MRARTLSFFSPAFALLAAAAWGQQPAEPPPPPQQKPLNEFNPTITVFHDMVWRLDNKDVIEVEDGEVIHKDDKFLLRETELDLRAAIDPYADGVFILAVEQEVPGEFEVDAEEAYARIKSLPFGFWEEPPLATKIKVGRFLPALGRHNRLHTHDLPQTQRGLAYEGFFGDHAYVANGVSAESLLPSFGDSAFTLTAEALQGGGWEFAEDGVERPAYVVNLSWFNTFADEHDVDLGLFGHYGHNDAERRRHAQLYGFDFLYKWKPRRQGEWNSIVIAGTLYYGSRDLVVDLDGDDDRFRDEDIDGDGIADDVDGDGVIDDYHEESQRAVGGFAFAQYQLDRRWYLGVRYDRAEYLEDSLPTEDDAASRFTGSITCYVTEFFRLRASYEFTSSDIHEDDDLSTFLLQGTFVFGSHPPHPYWVNQ